MLFRSNDTATTEIYTPSNTLSLHDALPINGPDASVFAISFGVTNPMGLSHYARLDGSSEIAVLPAFVAEEWERTGGTP